MRIVIKRSGPHSELDAEIQIPKEVLATRSPIKVAEYAARELSRRWAAAKGFDYDSASTLNYYAGMLPVILPLVREMMVREYQAFLARVREIKEGS